MSGKNLSAVENLASVIAILEQTYGSPRHGNQEDPLDELIYIKLSQQTNEPKFRAVYEEMRNRFPGWQGLQTVPREELEAILRPLGFHRQRASHLIAITEKIVADRGQLSLAWLREIPQEESISYLMSLPGVGIKTALCVGMYSLGYDVLPVDVHVQRISERLGIMPQRLSDKKKHEWLNMLIPIGKRYSYHVNCVSHGREICRKEPKCSQCLIQKHCAYYHAKLA